MSGSTGIDPNNFICTVQPLLAARDHQGLYALLRQKYTYDDIASLLSSPNTDARKIAALALALVGRPCCVPALAERLADADETTNEMAEYALWAIWFRCGTPAANTELAAGARALSDRDFEAALARFNRALELSPNFAEAYNQRAITYYLTEDYEKSAEDCRRVIELNPWHFGAWAGLGHSHAHLGRLSEAVECYRRALMINPHLDCIRQAVGELQKQISRQGA